MMRPTAPKVFLFSKENAPRRNPAAFLGFTFLVLPQVKMRLGFTSDCEFTCDAANRSGTPNIFQGKRASQEGISRGHCHCKFSFVPKPGRRPNVDKGAL